MTSAGRQDGDQERNVPAPTPSHQTEEQKSRTQTPQSTRLTREQEWSEQVPAAVPRLETEEWSVQPSQPLQILDAPPPENSVPDRLWDWWNEDPPRRWQIDQWRWNERELPAIRRINRTVIGTSGVAGMSAMTGIGGHLGPPEVMMKGCLRGQHGHILLSMSRKKVLRQEPASGVGRSQKRPGLTTAAC